MPAKFTPLALLGALAIVIPSCDPSASTTRRGTSKVKPIAAHSSTATLEIHQTLPYQHDELRTASPNFLNNQITIISANSLIEEVAKATELEAQDIQKALWIQAIEETDLIELSAFHDDEAIAKKIAESVIQTYVARRNRLDLADATSSLEALNNEITHQGDLVQEHRKELTILIQQYGIPYFEGRGVNPVGMTEGEMYRSAQKRLDEMEAHKAQLKVQIEMLMSIDNEELMRTAASFDLPDNQVAKYFSMYRNFSDQIDEKMASDLGSDHPAIVELRGKADRALENAREDVIVLKKVLNDKLTLLDRQVEEMRHIVDMKKSETVELSLKQHKYTEAKDAYEQARDLYREMKIKQHKARLMVKMPRTPVTIHGWDHR